MYTNMTFSAFDDEKKKKRIKVSDDDFAYASAYLRSSETSLVKKDDIIRLAQSKSFDEAVRMLSQVRIAPIFDKTGALDSEATISAYLKAAYENVSDATEGGDIFAFLRYPYDCHNIKSAIKCYFKGDDLKSIFIDLGTLSYETVLTMMRDRDFSPLPENMAKTAPLAVSEYERTHDPKAIDSSLDTACYADMSTYAKSISTPFFAKYIKLKIDTTNIAICARLYKMSKDEAKNIFKDYFIDGGTLPAGFFDTCFDGRIKEYSSKLSDKGFDTLASVITQRLSEIEKAADLCMLSFAQIANDKLCSADVVCAYIIERENDAKNLRIILASLSAGLDTEGIMSRLRLL